MLFNSYLFLFAFLPVVLAGFAILRRSPKPVWPILWVSAASLFYYAWWKPSFLVLLLLSIAVNLVFGLALLSPTVPRRYAQAHLTLGIVFNLAVLGYFKYAGFFVTNLNALFGSGWGVPQILLPIGISFITFQKIAFLVDAYRGEVRHFSILNYIFFVTFFPQLIAGPIVHHAEVMPQLADAPRRNFADDLAVGFSILIVGLFKKVVIADQLAVYADAGFGSVKAGHPLDTASAWVAVLSYSFQLYYDFSGYSDMAVGLGRLFGITLPVNFYSPYKATSFVDFWRRWHITLSRFLRDYLYIPLGGNRLGPVRRYVNLAAVMLLGGLWHGANWTFAIWGGVHGVALGVNHAWGATRLGQSRLVRGPAGRLVAGALTFLCVTLAWVPFRAESLADAQAMFGHLFLPLPGDKGRVASMAAFVGAQFQQMGPPGAWFRARELWPPALPPNYLAVSVKPVGLILLLVALATFLMPNTYQLFGRFDPALGLESRQRPHHGLIRRLDGRLAALLAAMAVLGFLGLSRVSPFLYFQF